MARRGRGSRVVSSEDTNDNSSPDPLLGLLDPLDPLPSLPSLLSPLDNFDAAVIPNDQRAFSMDIEPARGTLSSGSNVLPTLYNPRNDLNRAAICVRRKERREVLFAKKRFGRGGGRRSWRSDIKC